MRRITLVLLLITMGLTSCENEQAVKTDLQRLKVERTDSRSVLSGQKEMIRQQTRTRDELKTQITALRIEHNIVSTGKEPVYILEFKLKQSHFGLDIGQAAKDAMNAIKFEMAVDKEFYNSVQIGTNIVDDFRAGSAIINGSFGSWKMTVINKHLK